jgi:choline dehydrogenase-like flavoprotein
MTTSPELDCVVIGSGTSGAACAMALLDAGRTVHMIDAGIALEPERAEALAVARKNGRLTPETAPWVREQDTKAKIPRKLLYGSDFPFREAPEGIRLDSQGVGAEPTFALGGFSNVWGASALPFSAHDTADWPVSEAEMAPHYEACANVLNIAREQDDLAEWLPTYGRSAGQLRASNQAKMLLGNLEKNRDALKAAGVRFGRARVAAKTPETGGCTYCGLCLHGCPDKLIYNATETIAALRKHPRFSYQADVVVETLSETDDGARIHAKDRLTGAAMEFSARKVFVAAGAMTTTGMLLRSSGSYDKTLRLKDSQYFLLPLALFSGVRNVRSEELHTMAQIFLEMRDPEISPYTVHLQVYTYNDVLARTVRNRLGPMLEPAARWGDAHFVLVQGYLHSDHSGGIEMTLKRDGNSDRLEARGAINPETRRKIGAITAKLMGMATKIGAVPLAPLMEISQPGRGFHHGGSMPMSATPGAFDTDTLGRPFGWKRIHAVDATVLPSIPATTITYPVMANAHRIGSLAGGDLT